MSMEALKYLFETPWTPNGYNVKRREQLWLLVGGALGGGTFFLFALAILSLLADKMVSALSALALFWIILLIMILFEGHFSSYLVSCGISGVALTGIAATRIAIRLKRLKSNGT